MLEYPIKYWEPVLAGCSENPVPSIYIEPDVDLLTYFNENDNIVECTITGTDNPAYENKTFLATVDRSANMPNNRPNFYLVTGIYILTLTNYTSDGSAQTWWNGYPSINGTVLFRTGPLLSYTTTSTTAPVQSSQKTVNAYTASLPTTSEKNMKSSAIELVTENKKSMFMNRKTLLILLFIFIIVIVYLAMKIKSDEEY
jgi:hypothetical protein